MLFPLIALSWSLARAADVPAPAKVPEKADSGQQTQDDGDAKKQQDPAPAAKDESKVDPQTAQALRQLQDKLQSESDDGRKGVDPQMAKEIEDFLGKQQGGMSPDMKALVESAAKDGPDLSADTMQKLQHAARAVKAEGLDLGIKPDTEKSLLNDDFSKAPPPPQPLPKF